MELDKSLNPTFQCVSPSLDNFLTSEQFVECGDTESRDAYPQHSLLKKDAVKKSRKCVRKLEKPILLVVGEDISLNEIVLTNALTLVGRFGGRNISADGVHRWVADTWSLLISLCPQIFVLPRGWIAFKFLKVEDLDIILKGC